MIKVVKFTENKKYVIFVFSHNSSAHYILTSTIILYFFSLFLSNYDNKHVFANRISAPLAFNSQEGEDIKPS